MVHRYPDRVLIKPLLVCPVYCRFCFRREHVGPGGGLLSPAQLDAAIAYVRARPAVREVILTGGDPLLLSPRRLAHLVRAIEAIPHVELLRLHTRVPVADPSLVTAELSEALTIEKPLWLVVHANHAREFAPAALAGLEHELWQPWLDWAAQELGAPLYVTAGLMPVDQPPASIAALRDAVLQLGPAELGALGIVVPVTGSLVLGLALSHGAIDAATVASLTLLNERFQAEQWGEDPEARARWTNVKRDIADAARFMHLARQS